MSQAFDLSQFPDLPPEVVKAFAAVQFELSVERAARQHEQAAVAEKDAFITELKGLIAKLEGQVGQYRHAKFGPKSEKLDPAQLELALEDLETAIAETQAQIAAVEEKIAASAADPDKPVPRVPRKTRALPDSLARVERVIEPDSIACPCGCGDMVRIGEDRTERLDFIPARYQVIVTVRPKYACPKGRSGVVQAKAPAHLLEGSWPTEALLAQIAVSKHSEHMPLNRQAVVMARLGVPIERSVLADWMGRTTYPTYAGGNGLRTTLNLGYRHALLPSMVLTADAVLSYMRARTNAETGANGALALGVEKSFEGGLVIAVIVRRGFLNRKGRSGLFATPRRDDVATLFLRAYHGSFQIKGFAPTVEIGYERQKSNAEIQYRAELLFQCAGLVGADKTVPSSDQTTRAPSVAGPTVWRNTSNNSRPMPWAFADKSIDAATRASRSTPTTSSTPVTASSLTISPSTSLASAPPQAASGETWMAAGTLPDAPDMRPSVTSATRKPRSCSTDNTGVSECSSGMPLARGP
jgi:transposase